MRQRLALLFVFVFSDVLGFSLILPLSSYLPQHLSEEAVAFCK